MKLKPADKKWANEVKDREEWVCQRCHKGYVPGDRGLNAHHAFGRRGAVKYDLENGLALCVGCHRWVHANPYLSQTWLQETLGDEKFDALAARAHGKRDR